MTKSGAKNEPAEVEERTVGGRSSNRINKGLFNEINI